MGLRLKYAAAILLLVAALTNGLLGPLVHGHAITDTWPAGHAGIATEQTAAHAQHAGCHDAEPGDETPNAAGHSGKAGLLCSGSFACCAAVAVLDLVVIENRDRVAPTVSLRPALVGLTPPVGERPPSRA